MHYWKIRKVSKDCFVSFNGKRYSYLFRYVGQELKVKKPYLPSDQKPQDVKLEACKQFILLIENFLVVLLLNLANFFFNF
ncbi:Mu transposase domain-containing protein [Alkalicoccobacillus gibsonii]|uniref:Mu transposase domain-containing protein n=1 Tax=Alkalicoccobacillus gibsonii TaxID=79881 RepID=UPI003CCCEB2C